MTGYHSDRRRMLLIKKQMKNNVRIKSICAIFVCAATLLSGCVSVNIASNNRPDPAASLETGNTANTDAVPEDAVSEDVVTEDAVTGDPPPEGGISANLLPGADFMSSNSNWGLYTESGGSASFDASGGTLRLHIADPGRVGHAVQLYCDGFDMLEGGRYHFSADISSDTERTFEWRIQINGGDYHPYAGIKEIKIGQEMQEISCDFTMEEASDPAPRMCLNFGDEGKKQGLKEHNINIKNVSLILENAEDTKPATLTGELMNININQIGYYPDSEKRAVVRLDKDLPLSFDVVDVESQKSVYTGEVVSGINKGSSGDTVGYADFYDVKTVGRYRIDVDGVGSSFEFTIADDVFDSALKDTIRMLYLQRCGCELEGSLAGDFAHPACHTDEACLYGGKRYYDVSGGWHDAGDYGRYTVPAAKTVADLLLSYELYPGAFTGSLEIPESGNGIPDVLNEAKYELDWLFKMQSDDGGVFHKVTGKNFDGFVKAEDCTEDLYLLPESKTATADFAGVMYMAARVYKDFDPDFAAKCKAAADRAMEAYIAHKDDRNYTNPSDILTGEYADTISADEFLWAICEGYKTTGESKFEKMLDLVDISRITVDDFGWADMSGYAYYAYLTSKDAMKISFDVRDRFFKMADKLKDTALYGESYGSTFTDDYPWGSNMTIANNGMALLMAYSITNDSDYRLAAQRQLDYLFGTNCTSYCFLTGYGTQCPEHPHHRPSQAIGKCMKGMLVGGPDSFLEDPYAKRVLAGLPKARCYVDNEQTYSCNEVTIYWNSPLVFLLAGLR